MSALMAKDIKQQKQTTASAKPDSDSADDSSYSDAQKAVDAGKNEHDDDDESALHNDPSLSAWKAAFY